MASDRLNVSGQTLLFDSRQRCSDPASDAEGAGIPLKQEKYTFTRNATSVILNPVRRSALLRAAQHFVVAETSGQKSRMRRPCEEREYGHRKCPPGIYVKEDFHTERSEETGTPDFLSDFFCIKGKRK